MDIPRIAMSNLELEAVLDRLKAAGTFITANDTRWLAAEVLNLRAELALIAGLHHSEPAETAVEMARNSLYPRGGARCEYLHPSSGHRCIYHIEHEWPDHRVRAR